MLVAVKAINGSGHTAAPHCGNDTYQLKYSKCNLNKKRSSVVMTKAQSNRRSITTEFVGFHYIF